ncbi:MAG TPA: tetratricopeptide repeat protein [Terracidiphilus sp.]|nr:tetratricopeptide repeat protein [Terracidiphilus sp.]
MARLGKTRILIAALVALYLAIPRGLPGQAPAPSQPQVAPPQPQTAPPAAQAAPAAAMPPTPAPSATPPAPHPPPTAEQLGDSFEARQRYQAAIEAYAKAPVMTAAIWNKMGIAYQMMFNSRQAARCYNESLHLDPTDPQVLNNLGTVYASLKEYGQADRYYRRALKLDPKSAIVLKNLGTNLLAQHKYNKGWQAYQQALAIDPDVFSNHGTPSVDDPSSIQARGAMNYYMAAGCARAGYSDCALQYLRLALDEGFTTRKKVANDEEFASLRSNPAFKQLIQEEKRSQ